MITMALLWVMALPFLSSSWAKENLDSLYGPVVFSQVFFRHGIRGPLLIRPEKAQINLFNVWQSAHGQLTKEGADQHIHLGAWLRNRYDHLLPPANQTVYNPAPVYVMSSDVDRCVMSANANLAGMFPKLWPTVPVHTLPLASDNLIRLKRPCERHKQELKKFYRSEEYRNRMASFEKLMNYVSCNTGLNITEDPQSFVDLYINAIIQRLYKGPIPEWAQRCFPSPQGEQLATTIQTFSTWTPDLKRLYCGYLLNHLLTTMEKKVLGELEIQDRKIVLYSGHDTTLTSLLNTIGVHDHLIPPFAAAVLFELRYLPNEHRTPVITILYIQDVKKKPTKLKLPDCSEACPLAKVRELWTPFLVKEDAESCN